MLQALPGSNLFEGLYSLFNDATGKLRSYTYEATRLNSNRPKVDYYKPYIDKEDDEEDYDYNADDDM